MKDENQQSDIEKVREHCRFVGRQIEEDVAAGRSLVDRFEGTQMLRFIVEKDGSEIRVVGGEMGGDDSGIVLSERGVTKRFGDEIVGYAFDGETSAALVEFFNTLYFD